MSPQENANKLDSSRKDLEIVNLRDLRTPDEIQAAFQQLTREEELVDQELEQLLSEQIHLESRLKHLSSSLPSLQSAQNDAKKLADVIAFTAKLAEGVSVKVKQLDLAKSRVSECQQRVNDLIDLKLCSDGVKTALIEEDYEQAAAHLHRFLAMDENLLKLTASEMREEYGGEGGMASLEVAIATLHEAETKVKDVVSKRFDEAVIEEDLASIERFFKIFPLINMHDFGLEKFTKYLCEKVVETSKKNLRQAIETTPSDVRANVIFADTITLLFEGIARIVEIHQPLIETYYGPGRLLKVLSMLQEECDIQASKVVQEFRRKRNIKEKTLKVKESLYGTSSNEKQKVQAKDLDHVLSEMSILQARSEMYYKFVRKRVTDDLEVSANDEKSKTEKKSNLEKLITRSGLCHAMHDILADYILLEDYFMSQNVKMAMDNLDSVQVSEGDQLNSPILDDVFFILKKCVNRSISGRSVDGVCAVVNNVCRVLEQDFCQLLQNNLKMGFPSGYLDLTHAYNVIHSSYQQGKLQAGDTEKQKIIFMVALNSADNASDYISRLRTSLQQDVSSLVAHRSRHEKEKLESCLSGLAGVSSKLKSVLDQGMQLLRQSAVKPRVKPWLDAFVSHDINEDQFAEYEANDPFVQPLILNLDTMLATFKRSMTETNYESLVSSLISEVSSQMEKTILKSRFSRLGGLLLDKELRSLVSFLTSITTWTIRDKFGRLTQVSTILNLESVAELSDIWPGKSGHLSVTEAKQILNLRTDFQPDEIKRLIL